MTIADRIRIKREELHMTQDELAARCGYAGKSSISKIEASGDDITLKKIQRVAAALGVSHRYLMGWEGDDDAVKEPDNSEVTKKAIALYDRVMSLPPDEQDLVLQMLDKLQNKP